MKKRLVCLLICWLGACFMLLGDEAGQERLRAYGKHAAMAGQSPFKNLTWQSLGPYVTGGRVVDIEAYEKNPHKFLAASASGGLWLTEDSGTTWQSIFDDESSITIGDIAVCQGNEKLIWVGTGEANASPNTYAGTGIFKSVDGGKTWKNMGLHDSQHIGRIIVDPQDENIVYAAAVGHLYSENEERGVFKTEDGGKTWQKVLYISPNTGVIDLVMHPKNRRILYAASWQMRRRAWNMEAAGQESAVYKSVDGGKTWQKKVNGLPQGAHVGRTGLAISRSNADVVYALLDNQTARPKKRPAKGEVELTLEELLTMSGEAFLKLDEKKLARFLRENRAPKIYDARMLKDMVRSGYFSPKDIVHLLSEAREKFKTMVIGAEVYRSSDAGENWERTHPADLDFGIYKTYGFYFGQVRVCPHDENRVYIMGIPVLKSTDGGKTFNVISSRESSLKGDEVHVDSHAMWIDPANPRRILLGTDGGLYISHDRGAAWQKIANLPLAQCYTVNYDFQKPYRIYTGLQDNGVNIGSRSFRFGTGSSRWQMLLGADGASVEVRKDDPGMVYAAAQFGHIFRFDFKRRVRKYIRPQPGKVGAALRFNWLSPFMISRHDPAVLYMGANRMLKSGDRGDSWQTISPDLTARQHIDGNVPYATITSIDESPFSAAVLCVGTDDGNVWLTQDSGQTWKRISAVLPSRWVSRVIASQHKRERVYVGLSGHKQDDFNTYLFVSHDFGRNWESLKANLPDEPVNVIREDPLNPDILYLGTDLGVYVSLDLGGSWHSLKCSLPTIAVCDLQVQPREKELLIGSHGRGVFVLPLETIQQMKDETPE